MATIFKLKKSSVAGKKPLAGDLEYGELAINYADGRLYYKDDSNQVRSFIDSGQILDLVGDTETVFNIVNNGTSAYTFSGDGFSTSSDNPKIYLTRGKTYKFSVNSPTHPFEIRVASGGAAYNAGVTNNSAASGDIYFTPDMDAPDTLVYQCTVHAGMVGEIVIVSQDSFLDSAETINLIDSDYITQYVDSDHLAQYIDSDWVSARSPAAGITVMQTDSADSATRTFLETRVIRFDNETGFNVDSHAPGEVKVSLGSAFKTIKVAGDSDLVAIGEDTLEIKAGDFIDLGTSNNDSPNAKSLTVSVDSDLLRTFIDSVTSQDSIGHFINVDTNGVQDGQALVWDSDNGVFSPGTVAGSGGGFATINVTGSETLTTDSSSNTFRITAGSGMTITSDSASNTITFVSAGGGGGSVAADVTLNSFTGDSSTTAYTLGAAPVTDQNVFVTINGVSQHVDAYTLNNDILTFDSAPALGDAIETRIITAASVSLRDHVDYVYQPNPETYTLTGADINSNTLAYDIGKIEVFLNGSRLTPGLDYTATDGASVTLLTDYEVDSSDTVVISSFGKAYLIDRGVVPNQEEGDSASVQMVVDTYDASIYRTSKYIVQLMHDSSDKYHATEVLLTHNGTSVFMTEYGEVRTDSSLGTIDADILSGDVRLLVTPAFNNTSVKTQRITVGA